MSRIRRRRIIRTDKDPIPVPAWFTDTEHLSPCPCGEEPDASVIVFEGDTGLERWVHVRCLDRLEIDMDEEEVEEFRRRWEEYMRRHHEGNDE